MDTPNLAAEIPAEYEIIFRHLDDDLGLGDTDEFRKENEEINELRKIIAELSEPDVIFGTSSGGGQDRVPEVLLTYLT